MDHRPMWLVLHLIAVVVFLFCSSADGDRYTEAQCLRKCPKTKDHVCVMVKELTSFFCCNKSEIRCRTYIKKESELLNYLKPDISPSDPCRVGVYPCQHGGECHLQNVPTTPRPRHRLDPPPYEEDPPPPYYKDVMQVLPPPYNDVMRPRSDPQSGSIDDFYCVCTAKYTGRVCEIPIEAFEKGNNTDCEAKTCKNGKCIKTSRVFKKVEDNVEVTVPVAQRQDISNTLIATYKFKNDKVCVCDPGYRGMTCVKKCDPKTWGFYCLQTCHEACKSSMCDMKDGKCECTQGYFFVEDQNICMPPSQLLEKKLLKDNCKKFCNKKHGKCKKNVCKCKKEYYGGQWCDTDCLDFPRPRWGYNCIKSCFACAIRPCNRYTGICPLAPGRPERERCIAPFRGPKCSRLPGDEPAKAVHTSFGIFKQQKDYEKMRLKIARQCYSVETLSKLRQEVTVGINDAFSVTPAAQNGTWDGVVVDVQPLSNSQFCSRPRRAIKERRQAEENDNIEVQAEIYTPTSNRNATKAFRKAVKAGLDTMGRTFKSKVVPGLRVNKDSIKVSKAKVVLASDIAANEKSRSADSEPITSSFMTLVPAVFLVSLLIAMVGAVVYQLRSKSGGYKFGRARIQMEKPQRSKIQGKVFKGSVKKSHEGKRVIWSQVHQSRA